MTTLEQSPVPGAPADEARRAMAKHDRPARRARAGLLLLVLLTAQLMAVLDVNIVNVAAATIRSDLHTTGAELQLIIAGYTIAYAVLLITGARLGGLVGYRRMFLGGLAAFTVASLACGLAPDAAALVAFRFVQGAGAAAMIPQVFSLIQRHFAGGARARALGRYAAVIAGGSIAGQVLGGVLVDANLWGSGWRPIFFINVPIGVLLLLVGARALPREAAEPGRHLDLPGLVTLAAAVLALVLPLVFGSQYGWPAWTWLSMAGSIVLLAGFGYAQTKVAHPLMPGHVLRAPGLVVAVTAVFMMMASYAGYLFSLALALQGALHYSPLRAGLTFTPLAVAFAVSSLNWRRLPGRWHGRLIPIGLIVTALSLLLVSVSLRHAHGLNAAFFVAQVPFGLGAGLAFSPLVGRALAHVAPADASDASGLVTTMVQLSQVIGLASLGSLYLALVGRHGSADAIAVSTLVEAAGTLVAALIALFLPRAGRAVRTKR